MVVPTTANKDVLVVGMELDAKNSHGVPHLGLIHHHSLLVVTFPFFDQLTKKREAAETLHHENYTVLACLNPLSVTNGKTSQKQNQSFASLH